MLVLHVEKFPKYQTIFKLQEIKLGSLFFRGATQVAKLSGITMAVNGAAHVIGTVTTSAWDLGTSFFTKPTVRSSMKHAPAIETINKSKPS